MDFPYQQPAPWVRLLRQLDIMTVTEWLKEACCNKNSSSCGALLYPSFIKINGKNLLPQREYLAAQTQYLLKYLGIVIGVLNYFHHSKSKKEKIKWVVNTSNVHNGLDF